MDTYVMYDGTDLECEEKLGYTVYESHPLANIVCASSYDAKLYVGSYEVVGYKASEFCGYIPALYCIRRLVTYERSKPYNEFVCGFDLTSDGNVWVGLDGGVVFDTVEKAMVFIQNEVGNFSIFTEEKIVI